MERGATIRVARLNKSMSLGQLASAVGRSSSSVRRWERGEVAPAASVLPKLAAILEIDPDALATAGSPDSTNDDVTDPEPTSDVRVSTVEQPLVEEPDVELAEGVHDETRPSRGLIADTWDVLVKGGRGWRGWIRGIATVVLLLVMLFVLLWAIGELVDALGDVWDSFDAGSNGSEDA